MHKVFHFFQMQVAKVITQFLILLSFYIPILLAKQKKYRFKMNNINNNIRQIVIDTELLDYLSDASTVCNRIFAFNDLLQSAVQEPTVIIKRGIKVPLEPGQLEASIITLSNRWGWHRQTIATFLNELETLGYIKRMSNKISTIIEITCFKQCTTKEQSLCTTESPGQHTSDSVVQCTTEFGHIPDVAHHSPPMQLSDELRQICKEVYDLFIATFPLLDKPEPYNPNIEKDIFYVFCLGMRGNFDMLNKYFAIINADPFKNGSMADTTGASHYKVTFQELFSSNWQTIFDCAAEYHQVL